LISFGKQHVIRPAAKNRDSRRCRASGGGLNPRKPDVKIPSAVGNNRGPAAIHNRERTRRQIRRRRSGGRINAIDVSVNEITIGVRVAVRGIARKVESYGTYIRTRWRSPVDRKRVCRACIGMFSELNGSRSGAIDSWVEDTPRRRTAHYLHSTIHFGEAPCLLICLINDR